MVPRPQAALSIRDLGLAPVARQSLAFGSRSFSWRRNLTPSGRDGDMTRARQRQSHVHLSSIRTSNVVVAAGGKNVNLRPVRLLPFSRRSRPRTSRLSAHGHNPPRSLRASIETKSLSTTERLHRFCVPHNKGLHPAPCDAKGLAPTCQLGCASSYRPTSQPAQHISSASASPVADSNRVPLS